MFTLRINENYTNHKTVFDGINAIAKLIKKNKGLPVDARVHLYKDSKDFAFKKAHGELRFSDKQYEHMLLDCLYNDFE